MDDLLSLALSSDNESEIVDFKESFDVTFKGEWCEVIKDIVAMANSGGGILLIGIKDDGQVSGANVDAILDYDPADITNKLFSYTGRHFSNFKIINLQKDEHTLAALQVGGVSIPLVFTNPGNYQGRDGKPKCAFASGTVYFRHGAKSQPCTSDDLQSFLKREIDIVKESWLSGIRKVVEAPEGSKVVITQDDIIEAVRLVNDESAPTHKLLDPNKTHPYRPTDAANLLNERLEGRKRVNLHDINCIKRIHNIAEVPRFYYQPLHSSGRYSKEFIEWVLEKYEEDHKFFDDIRAKMHEVIIEENKWRVKKKKRL